ncbi:MAG: hypothetical protein ACUVV3_04940 [Dehalococcoidia bacterium]
MIRLAFAALVGALVGAIVAAGVSLLAFAYPVRTEISNFPLDENGNIPVAGTIRTVIGAETAAPADGTVSELVGWRDASTLQCVCWEGR